LRYDLLAKWHTIADFMNNPSRIPLLTAASFSTLNLNSALIENLTTLGYESMTPIQARSLPLILEGKDVIAQAKTGSGKTAAFGLGLIEKLNVKRFRIQTLVLCPTRELADQVAKEIRRLARTIHNIKVLTLCGGKPFGPQIGSLEHGAHIIVGTPGRVEEHVRKGTLNLEEVSTYILDEADRMLEMGFQDSLEKIVEHMPKKRQTLLFSATFPDKIKQISNDIMTNPEMVKVISTHDTSTIQQEFYKVDNNEERLKTLQLILMKHKPVSSVVFCNTKAEAQDVADALRENSFSAMATHGDLDQKDRDQVLIHFSSKCTSILVATDVAARGLDIEALDAVINYHISRDPEVHTHRIGRTGRAGKKGLACSLYSEKESYKIAILEESSGLKVVSESLPSAEILGEKKFYPQMACIQIDGGKRQKVRAGDILGALTGERGIDGSQVGKITLLENKAYVAVDYSVVKMAVKKLSHGQIKGKTFKVRWFR